MTKTTTWMGQPAHQMVFPITIAEGRRAISMSRAVHEHRDLQFPMETIRAIERETHVTSSGTDEDEYGGAHVPSPTVTSIGRRRRARGQRRVWTPLPQYPGLSQMVNPMPYPPTGKLPSTSHNDSYPDGSPTSPISLTSSTHPSPIDASTPSDSSCCPGGTGQRG